MKLLMIGWVGTWTENPDTTADFVERVLAIRAVSLPMGSKTFIRRGIASLLP